MCWLFSVADVYRKKNMNISEKERLKGELDQALKREKTIKDKLKDVPEWIESDNAFTKNPQWKSLMSELEQEQKRISDYEGELQK